MALAECGVQVNAQGRELAEHGTALFPMACYRDDLSRQQVPWHWHDEWEAAVVEQGTAVLHAGECVYTLGAGEGFFLNASVLHSVLGAESPDCLMRSVVFHPRLVGGELDSVFWQSFVRPVLSNAQLRTVLFTPDVSWQQEALSSINDGWSACVCEPSGYEFQARTALSHLVFLLGEHCPPQPGPPDPRVLRGEQRVKAMLAYIQTHYADELTVAAVARSAAVSESECMRCFRSVLNTTPVQYIRRLRVQRAAELLKTTGLSVAEIGARCGFREMSYFSKLFRETHGCTPREYRQNETAR